MNSWGIPGWDLGIWEKFLEESQEASIKHPGMNLGIIPERIPGGAPERILGGIRRGILEEISEVFQRCILGVILGRVSG